MIRTPLLLSAQSTTSSRKALMEECSSAYNAVKEDLSEMRRLDMMVEEKEAAPKHEMDAQERGRVGESILNEIRKLVCPHTLFTYFVF